MTHRVPTRIDPRRLETFRVVASSGQISSAARLLHLSQPAVTAQIRQLEDACGRALFQRTARGMVLNDAGRALLETATRVHSLLVEAESTLEVETERPSELVFAASTTVAAAIVPELLARFLPTVPGCGARVEVGNTAQAIEHIRRGDLELGLVEGPGRAPGVRLVPYLRDELVPVIGADAPRALQSVRTVTQLDAAPLLWREAGSGTRAVVQRALRKAGSKRRPRLGDLQLGSTAALQGAARRGLGVAFLSRWTVDDAIARGELRILSIAGLTIQRDYSWVLAGGEPKGLAGRFYRFAAAHPPRR